MVKLIKEREYVDDTYIKQTKESRRFEDDLRAIYDDDVSFIIEELTKEGYTEYDSGNCILPKDCKYIEFVNGTFKVTIYYDVMSNQVSGVYVKQNIATVTESKKIKESISTEDKKFKEAVRFCDGTLEDLADELWRRYIDLDDAINVVNAFYDGGKGRRSLLQDIEYHVIGGDLEDVIEDVYRYRNDEMNAIKPQFGRV